MGKLNERLKNGIPESHYYFLLEWKDENSTEWEYQRTHIYIV